jgi:hypothetical protein
MLEISRCTSSSDDLLTNEAVALGREYAAANLRLDMRAPAAFIQAHKSYRGLKQAVNDYFERKLLGLRLNAIKRGYLVDAGVTSEVLRIITGNQCLVSLEPFSFTGQHPTNASVDRLINDGTYAVANLAMFTQRVNRAKGTLTFEEVINIAQTGESVGGLDAQEWVRLASLMYGAWDAYNGASDPYLIPLATYPGKLMFTSESQLVQLLLLRACLEGNWPDSLSIWCEVSRDAGESPEQFVEFMGRLRQEVLTAEYPPMAWLAPKIFKEFAAWYVPSRPAINRMLTKYHSKYQQEVSVPALIERWDTPSSQQI